MPFLDSEIISLLGRTAKDHCALFIAQRSHPTHAFNYAAPSRPGIVGVDSTDRPVAAKHDTAGAKGGEDNTEPTESSLENVVGVLVS